jgi:hypothetical protein
MSPYLGVGGDFKSGSEEEDRAKRRNEWFLALVRETQIDGTAWIISSPGNDTVTLETLTTSTFADELKRRGYPLREIELGERILPFAHHQPMEVSSSGALVPTTAGSTRPVSMIVHSASPHPTRRFEFPAPFRTGR